MNSKTIELVYFAGCPNVPTARENIRGALMQAGGNQDAWTEWDVEDAATPEHYRSFGSPTVLVDGEDVLGAAGGGAGLSCRAEGSPSVLQIVEAIGGNP